MPVGDQRNELPQSRGRRVPQPPVLGLVPQLAAPELARRVGLRDRPSPAVLVGALQAVGPSRVAADEGACDGVVVAALQVVEATVVVVGIAGVAQQVAIGQGGAEVRVGLDLCRARHPPDVVAIGDDGAVVGVEQLEHIAALVGDDEKDLGRALLRVGGLQVVVDARVGSPAGVVEIGDLPAGGEGAAVGPDALVAHREQVQPVVEILAARVAPLVGVALVGGHLRADALALGVVGIGGADLVVGVGEVLVGDQLAGLVVGEQGRLAGAVGVEVVDLVGTLGQATAAVAVGEPLLGGVVAVALRDVDPSRAVGGLAFVCKPSTRISRRRFRAAAQATRRSGTAPRHPYRAWRRALEAPEGSGRRTRGRPARRRTR